LRIAAALFSAFFALAVAAAGVLWWGEREFRKPGPLDTAQTLIIPKGTGLADIAGRLEAAGVIESSLLFRTALRIQEQAHLLRAGEYEFAPGISQEAVARQLIEGRTVVHRLTLAEGLTTAEILQMVAAAEALEGDLTVSVEEG